MNKKITEIKHFLKKDIWRISKDDVSKTRYFIYGIIKKLYITIEAFITNQTNESAAALTYSTLLAIVPITAVVFAVARGFGQSFYIEKWFRGLLESQPQAADTIIGFVNSYLIHTKSGIFLGVGLIFMLWTVLMLTSRIERAFNDIWQVKKPRSVFRTFTDYLAMFFMVPIIIVVSSGLSIFIATTADNIDQGIIAPFVKFLIDLMPYVFMVAVFTTLYVFMPNTNVKFRSAIVPGILTGVAMQVLQIFYIHSQVWVSSYNAIYGSFAALPMFMLWLQISWTICLIGAELTYTNQNLEEYAFVTQSKDISIKYHTMMCALIMGIICKRFKNGKAPATAIELKKETNIPIRVINDILYELMCINMVSEILADEKGEIPAYQPAEALDRLTYGTLVDRLESHGKWYLNIDIRKFYNSSWKHMYNTRTEYLKNLRDIPLYEL